ncbi:Zinc finger CCCH domain-containing protein 24 [Tetrabaena socialis]|uniref:Zinc finger CCCH domain-containing protein 24 n=1 Tax=Tetrabaena socialis TaxID=47790 RepID=A0A2J8ADX4_9CHLO|nr:Zinc finger CCCH domain-containing protein 24 [Tetrabaena socialis]|eukprot:PNH10713.1 Zinc finger CCCH domain-containing protein 24 [Tetrabaena socialis]
METEVIGHYLVPAAGRPAQPLLHESTSLFQAVVSDRLSKVESAVEADAAKLNQFFLVLHWASDVKGACPEPTAEPLDAAAAAAAKASVMVKQRSLLMIAAHAGSLRVLAYLLARGAEPGRKSPDGLTAYDMAVDGETSSSPTALAMMRDADSNPSSSTRSSSNESYGTSGRQDLDSDGSAYSTMDLTRPEYSTDDFRMFNFKVLRCSKRHAHDWRACPFAHPTENARRRDPREFKYCALACPDYKQGFCIRGDVCPYAHGVFECWLHPSRYRTQLCKDGSNCHRPVCFFAHSLPELRAPTFTWVPTQADLTRPAAYSNSTNNSGAGGNGNNGGHGMGAVLPPGAVASAVAALALGAVGDGVITIGASAAAEARALMSHSSSGIPATGSSSDGCCATATCSSPRALSIGGSGNGGNGGSGSLSGGNGSSMCGGNGSSMCGGNGNGSLTGSSMCGGNGNGSHSSSNGAIGSPSPSGSVGSREGGSSSSCNSGCGGISTSNITTVIVNDNGSKVCHTTGGGSSPGASAAAAAAAAKLSLNLTQPNAAAGVLGFTAPRMSNAFARRHGLNPKDNPMINLQKIALQSHQQQQQQSQQPQQMQMQSGNGLGGASSLNGFQQDAPSLRAHHAPAGTGSGSLHAGRGGIANGNGGQQRMHAAAAAAAVAASSHAGFGPLGYAASAAPFCSMQSAGHPLSAGAADPAMLAAQLAALNLQQQRQSHHSHHHHHHHHNQLGLTFSGLNGLGGLGGLGSMSMTSGAAAAAAAAAAMPYMTVAGQHQALMQHHSNMYGSASNGMYDHSQQHHLMAAMSGAQAEV